MQRTSYWPGRLSCRACRIWHALAVFAGPTDETRWATDSQSCPAVVAASTLSCSGLHEALAEAERLRLRFVEAAFVAEARAPICASVLGIPGWPGKSLQMVPWPPRASVRRTGRTRTNPTPDQTSSPRTSPSSRPWPSAADTRAPTSQRRQWRNTGKARGCSGSINPQSIDSESGSHSGMPECRQAASALLTEVQTL